MGYMAVILPVLFVIIGSKLAKWYAQLRQGWQYKASFVAFFSVVNTCVFLYIPSYMGYQNIKNYEENIKTTKKLLNKSIDPDNTLVIAMDAFRYGFREIGYYSPEYYVVQYPEMKFSDKNKVFAMRDRKTLLLSKLPLDKYSNFVMYTMPRDRSIQEELWKRFPEGRISKGEVDGITFLEGPSSELKFLFPKTSN
jgi:hypothetical protein